MKIFIFVMSLIIVSCSASKKKSLPKKVTEKVIVDKNYFKGPEQYGFKFSPKGTYLSHFQSGKKFQIILNELDKGQERVIFSSEQMPKYYKWITNDLIFIKAGNDRTYLYPLKQDKIISYVLYWCMYTLQSTNFG